MKMRVWVFEDGFIQTMLSFLQSTLELSGNKTSKPLLHAIRGKRR